MSEGKVRVSRKKGGKKGSQAPAQAEQTAPAAGESPVAEAPAAPAPESTEEDNPQAEPAKPAEQPAETPKEPAKPEPQPTRALSSPDPDSEEIAIEDAAGAMVDGFKESWLPAIRAKATTMGVKDKASRRTWRGVFVAWGGAGILR